MLLYLRARTHVELKAGLPFPRRYPWHALLRLKININQAGMQNQVYSCLFKLEQLCIREILCTLFSQYLYPNPMALDLPSLWLQALT